MIRVDGHDWRNLHTRWRADAKPIRSVEAGELFQVRVPDSSSMQLGADSTSADLVRLDYDKVDAAVGPIEILGLVPGDAIEVEIRSIRCAEWGWSGIFRHFGLLQDRFDDELVTWTIGEAEATPRSGFLRRVKIPLRPMLGVVGVAPTSGEFLMIPPQHFGGNMDNRSIGAGAKLVLPVHQAGALLSVGDPHAAMGDGEVCGTGIETGCIAEFSVRRLPGAAPRSPRLTVREPSRPGGERLVTMGIGPDLKLAAREAVEELLVELERRGWSSKEAYLLASVVGDLRISEIVDEPNFVVSMDFPIGLFAE